MKFEKEIVEIPVDKILPNRFLDREISEPRLNELAESIRIWGIIEPVLVKRLGDVYEMINGECRLKAAKKAGFIAVPAVVLDMNFNDSDIAGLPSIINYFQESFLTTDEAHLYQIITRLEECSSERLAELLKIPHNRIEERITMIEKEDELKTTEMLYETMEELFYDYLVEMDDDEDSLIHDLRRLKNPRLVTYENEDSYEFVIEDEEGLKINFGTVDIDADEDEKIEAALKASIIATVAYDKAFDNISDNLMRSGGKKWFEIND